MTFTFDLQLFATTGTTVLANPGASRRAAVRGVITWAIDTTVTSPSTAPVPSQAGGIGAAELVYMTANKQIAGLSTAGASNANAANCVGVANGQYPYLLTDGVYVGDPTSGVGSPATMDVIEDGEFLFATTSGDTYSPLDAVYLGANGRTVSKTATGTKVGYVSPDQRGIGGVGVGNPYSFSAPTWPFSGGAGIMLYIRIQPALTNANG